MQIVEIVEKKDELERERERDKKIEENGVLIRDKGKKGGTIEREKEEKEEGLAKLAKMMRL